MKSPIEPRPIPRVEETNGNMVLVVTTRSKVSQEVVFKENEPLKKKLPKDWKQEDHKFKKISLFIPFNNYKKRRKQVHQHNG